jgi:excisionase family DNA binding protein
MTSQTREYPDKIMTITEVASELRCSKAHVYNAIKGKVAGISRLPAIHMGRRKLVRRSALEHWKCENEVHASSGILGSSSEIDAVGA